VQAVEVGIDLSINVLQVLGAVVGRGPGTLTPLPGDGELFGVLGEDFRYRGRGGHWGQGLWSARVRGGARLGDAITRHRRAGSASAKPFHRTGGRVAGLR